MSQDEIYCPDKSIYTRDLSHLRILNCSNFKIDELPQMPFLEELYCQSCPIKSIQGFPSLKVLDCSYSAVESLTDLKQLELLK